MSSSSKLHVVLGAGQIGPRIARWLVARGHAVRLVQRSHIERPPPGVEVLAADVSTAEGAERALGGAAVAYHVANPAYHTWGETLLPLARGILEGARRTGAALVVLDNLYGYGDTARMTETSAVAPRSKKGALRAQAASLFVESARRGDVRAVLGRAADFVGPGSVRAAVFGDRFWKALLAGRVVDVLGDVDLVHSYSAVDDVAAGLATLGTATGDDVWRGAADTHVWHLPVTPPATTRAWVEAFAAEVGVRPRMRGTPAWLLRLLGMTFVPEAGELPEMMYQWRAPFVLDDAAFRARFGLSGTPMDVVVRDSVTWARAAFAPGAPSPARA
jgi:nucleoside-diphosphate-sugar epimerase